MLPIGPLAIILRHTNADRPRIAALAVISAAGILAGLAMLIR